MNGLIVATKHYSLFPSGGISFCGHAAKILDSKIWTPDLLESEYPISQIGTIDISKLFIREVYDWDPIDYILIGVGQQTAFGGLGFIDWRKQFSTINIPVIVMMHDIWYIHENKEFLTADGFIVSMDETADEIRKFKPDAKIIRMKLPYSYQPILLDFPYRKNSIISTGRIVPEKGHRHVAQLARLGYNIHIAGHRVDHDEYLTYFNKINTSGVIMHASPTPEELKNLLQQSKIFMSFTYTAEQHCQPEYSFLEAVNCGCYPIVANWMEKYTDETGIHFSSVECVAEAIPIINEIFRDDVLYRTKMEHNLEILKHWSEDYKSKLESFSEILR